MPDRRELECDLSRRALLLGIAAAAAAPLVACDRSAPVPALLSAGGVARAEPAADAPAGDVAVAMAAFAHRMVAANARAGDNWVLSPLSIACAFAMARAGAAGTTAAQLDQVFGFPERGRDAAFNAVTRDVAPIDGPPRKIAKWKAGTPPPAPVVSLGNALFTAKSLAVGKEFLRTLAADYGTGARPVDFTSGQATAQINAWVKQQTAGRITELFDRLAPATLLVLANAVYFKGYWTSPFEAQTTADQPFTRADGSQVPAPTMTHTATVRYASVQGVQAVELPYAGGPYAMLLLLPPSGGKPADVLDPRTVGAVTSALADQPVTVSLPRFDLHTDLDLGEVLRTLGLTAPFGSGADFSGIAPGLYVSQAVHRATITVDEQGTEAAAATGVGMTTSGMVAPTLSFRADRPFAFLVLGGRHRVPLFAGQVYDPTAT